MPKKCCSVFIIETMAPEETPRKMKRSILEQLFLYNLTKGVLELTNTNPYNPRLFYSDSGGKLRANSQTSFEATLLALLSRFPLGLRTDQIRSSLAREGVHRSLAEIARTLRELSESNKIRFEHQKWVTFGPIEHQNLVPPLVIKPQWQEPSSIKRSTSDARSCFEPCELKYIRAIHFEYKRFLLSNEVETATDQGGSLPSGWELFRRLAPYYRDCLRAEERPSMIVGAEKSGERFLALTSSGKWWPTQQEAVSLSLKMDDLPNGFLRALSKRGDDETFVGYPVVTIPTRNGDVLLQPIFTLSCRVGAISGDLKVYIPPQMPDINDGWFEKFFKDKNEGLKFLQWIGIQDLLDGEDNETGACQEFVEISDAASRYMAFMGREKSSQIIPERLSETLRLSTDRAYTENSAMLFLASLTRYNKGAIRELSSIAEWPDDQLSKTCLSVFIREDTRKNIDQHTPTLTPINLNEEQLNSVKAGLESKITVITGPPGTGKSQAVAAIMASAALIGKSSLLASKNHKALDAIEERLSELTGDRSILIRVSRPWGSERPFDLKAAIDAILSRNVSQNRADYFWNRVSSLKLLDRTRWELYGKLEEIDQLQGVLASNRELATHLTNRLGKKSADWVKNLRGTLETPNSKEIRSSLIKFTFIDKLLRRLDRKRKLQSIIRCEVPWEEIDLPVPTAENIELCVEYIHRLEEFRRILQENQVIDNRIRSLPHYEQTLATTIGLHEEITTSSGSFFMELPDILDELTESERLCLLDLRGSMSVLTSLDPSDLKNEHARNLWEKSVPIVLKHFPLWGVTNLSASRIPFFPAMFDYLIIDEASACDIPSAVPLFARAKQVVVVGDPAQLQHVTKLSIARERELLSKNEILKHGIGRFTHRENSVFNLGSSVPNASRHLLREHYRCHEGIADYFNQTFYGGRLRVMTDAERLLTPRGDKPGLHWTNVTGPISPARSGCYAQKEIDAILSYLKEILINGNFSGTVGVVTAFREQANRIMDRISVEIPTETILKTNLGAFTAHQFQGDARDIVALSLCVGPDMPAGSLSFVSQSSNLVNVAVSRAKAVCNIFGDMEFARNSGIHHLSTLVHVTERASRGDSTRVEFESPWEKSLHEALASRGIDTIPQYPLAGRRLDLALIYHDLKIDIEVDGSAYHRNPDGSRKSGDLWRDFQITSLGWQVKRFWVYQLKENMEACVDDIVRTISGHRKIS